MTRAAAFAGLIVVLIASVSSSSRAQGVVIDRVLSRVNADVVTASDVWRVRRLKLIPAETATDDTIQRTLEDRRVMLAEILRFSIVAATPDQLSARRDAWRARFPAGTDTNALLRAVSWSTSDLDDWLRDDARLEAYLAQQFTQPQIDQRASAIADWIKALRRRAGLPA